MFKNLLIASCVAGVLVVPAVAYAQPAPETVTAPVPGAEPGDVPVENPTDELNVGDTIYKIVQDARKGDWRHVAAGALLLLMLGLRRFRDKLKIFKGDRGGSILVMILALGGAVATTLATDMPIDLKMLASTVAVAFTAVGGYSWVKKIIWPND